MNTYEWFKQRVYYLEDEQGYDPANFDMAWQRVKYGEKLALGVIYKTEKPTYEELMPGARSRPVVKEPIEGVDYTELIEEFF